MDTVRVGILGLGVVGLAVAERLRDEADLIARRAGVRVELAGVVVRDVERARARFGEPDLICDNAERLIDDPSIEIVVEVIGGIDPAHAYIVRALDAGRSVVTANKAVIATSGADLVARGGSRLRFEAAVGGGIPIIETLRGGLSAQRVRRIEAVINGTTNVMLDAMAAGGDYAAALANAQLRGFAEADPSSDVDGFDSAYKLAIMASLAGDGWIGPDAVRRVGITHLRSGDFRAAWLCGHSIRLLASARIEADSTSLRVEPVALRRAPSPHTDRRAAPGHPLADLRGPENGILVTTDMLGGLLLCGAGAGGEPTAGAVLADVIALARARHEPPESREGNRTNRRLTSEDDDEDTAALLVVESERRDVDVDVVRQLLEDRGVGVASVARDTDDPLTVRAGVLTSPSPRSAIAAAVATLDADPRFQDGIRWMPARG